MSQNISQHFGAALARPNNPEQQLAQYQNNMKIFIRAVQKQMTTIIDRYQAQIKSLKSEIAYLKRQANKKNATSTALGLESHMSQCFSPIKFKGGLASGIQGLETARSNFLQDFPIKTLFGTDSNLHITQQKAPSLNYKFQIDKNSDKLSKSRFQIQSKKKRQRQQQLLNSLEMGKSNLQLNTDKMFTLIGRPKSCQKKDEESVQVNTPESPTNIKKRRASEAHNTSLNSLCDSLNNSFHGRKAQSKSLKKKKQKESKQSQQARRQQERQRKKKEQGIKNLLSTMRNNIDSSPQKPAEVIKTSKLLTTGQKGKNVQFATKAKVMINPVAVDVIERNKQKQQNSATTSPSKNPQSILKNSSTNFLSKSIENISAISFHQSGGQQ